MTKVLWVINSLGLGGAERQIINMASILTKKDFEIDVVYYSNKDTRMLDDAHYAFKTLFIDKDKIGNIKCLLQLRQLIIKNRYDIVHAFGGGTANFYGRFAAFFTKTKIVIGAMLGKKHFVSLKSRIANSIGNLRSSYWTINNIELEPILRSDLKFIKKNHVFLLNNGYCDRSEISYKEYENTYYDQLKRDNKVFVEIGRLEKVKDIHLFISAAENIIKHKPNVQFWIIGDGSLYQELNKRIKNKKMEDKIKLLGYRSDIDIALSRADVYTLTSLTEGSPNAMAEAMRAKKPLISTRCTSLHQFIIEKKNGISIDVGSKEQLTEAMLIMLAKRKEELQEMGNLSYELFKKNFEINKVAEEFYHLYNDLLGDNNEKNTYACQ